MMGGKLKSWRDTTFGVPPLDDPDWKGYPHDHGAHADHEYVVVDTMPGRVDLIAGILRGLL